MKYHNLDYKLTSIIIRSSAVYVERNYLVWNPTDQCIINDWKINKEAKYIQWPS